MIHDPRDLGACQGYALLCTLYLSYGMDLMHKCDKAQISLMG